MDGAVDEGLLRTLTPGWMVAGWPPPRRPCKLAGGVPAPRGAGAEPIHEWLEVRPFLGAAPTITE